jgi:4-amino-4-deoxy-L-arabinose transferase-like glycosyltransferase
VNGTWFRIVLGVIAIFAAGIRIWNLDARSIWFDEAFSWTLAGQFGPAEIIARTGNDVHPPLYYLTLWLWLKVAGDSLFSMRLLSVVFGTAAVVVAGLLGKEMVVRTAGDGRSAEDEHAARGGRCLGVCFALLLASSPFQIHWSGEVRMYSLLTLLFLLSVLSALKAIRSAMNAVRWWTAFAVTSAAMLYTHNYGLFSFVAMSFFLLSYAALQGRNTGGWRPFRSAVLACCAAAVLYLPWVPSMLHQRSQVAENYWISPFSLRQLFVAWDGVVFPENGYSAWQETRGGIALTVTIGLAIALQFRGQGVDRLAACLTVIPVALAVAMSVTSTSIIAYRLFVLVHVGALLCVARGCQRWLELPAAILMVLVLSGDSLWLHGEYVRALDLANQPGPRGAMEWIDDQLQPGESVYVRHPCIYFSLRFHARDPQRVVLCTSPENILHYTGGPILRDGERSEITAMDAVHTDRVLIADTTGFTAGYSRPGISPQWEFEREQRFAAPYSFEGELLIQEYRRRSVQDPSSPSPGAG